MGFRNGANRDVDKAVGVIDAGVGFSEVVCIQYGEKLISTTGWNENCISERKNARSGQKIGVTAFDSNGIEQVAAIDIANRSTEKELRFIPGCVAVIE